MNFSGYSAAGILDQLSGRYVDGDDDEGSDYDRDHDHVNEHDGHSCGDGEAVHAVSFQPMKTTFDVVSEDRDHGNGDDDDDDAMSFCYVGYVLDQVEGDEDWCLVGEM